MASFFSPYSHEFVRLGACVPHVAVADPRQNADNVLDLLASGDKASIALMVFPELGISAYAIDDLLFQDALLESVDPIVDVCDEIGVVVADALPDVIPRD